MALLDILRKSVSKFADYSGTAPDSISAQIQARQDEHDKVTLSDDLTPKSIGSKNRRYHYKDVNIIVFWQYGGRYGKTCEDLGVKRGDIVNLQVPQQKTDDPDDIAINWHGIDLGLMKNNRLRNMVHQWKNEDLPVISIVSQVGGVHKLFIEFAFYGYPRTK